MTDPILTRKPEFVASQILAIYESQKEEVEFDPDDKDGGEESTCNRHYTLSITPLLDWDNEEAFRRRSGIGHEEFFAELNESIMAEELFGEPYVWCYHDSDSPRRLNFISPYKKGGDRRVNGLRTCTYKAFQDFNKKMHKKYKLRLGVDYDLDYLISIVHAHGRISQHRVCALDD